MSGIYIHIPFCKKACYYCDFHFSTNNSKQDEMVEAIIKEIQLQKNYLNETVETIYFGGGTPSLLTDEQINRILQEVYQQFEVDPKAEITLESNPDDLKADKLVMLQKAGVNRLSIGIQSFHTPHLQSLNRVHTGEEAYQCVKKAQDIGFENITIDLIYGIPSSSHDIWEHDLQKAIALDVPHISSYCLTIEEKTVLGNWTKKGKYKPADDEFSATQFEMLMKVLKKNEYQHYEISNFAKEGWYSRHNSAYWQKKDYLGIGPSAHSFNGSNTRQFNISNNALYTKAIMQGNIPCEKEVLDQKDQVNEYLLTSLRTHWGTNLHHMKHQLGFDFQEHHAYALKRFIDDEGLLTIRENTLYLTEKGKLFADMITEELFWI